MATSPPSKLDPALIAQILSSQTMEDVGGNGMQRYYTDPATGQKWYTGVQNFGTTGTGDASYTNRNQLGDVPWIGRDVPNPDGGKSAFWENYSPTGDFLGTGQYDNSWKDMIQAMALAAPAVGGIVGAAGTAAGGGGGLTAASGGSGLTAGGGSTIAGGSGLTAGGSAGYGTIGGASGLGGTGAGLSATGTIATPGLTAGTVGSSIAGTGAATGSFTAGGGGAGTKTLGDKVMDTLTSPSTVRAAVGAAGAIAGANKSGDSMSDLANSNVNPATLVPLLQSIYGDNWRDQLNASRYNIVNDSGTSTWSQTPSFNETGYNAAMKAYNDGVAAGNKNLPMPSKEQFTTSTWTNTSKLNPDAQKLKDTSSANNQWIADSLTPQMQKYASTVNAGVNRTGIPNYQYTANTKDQQQQNPNSLPTYQNITDTGKFQTPQYGQLTQGPIQNKVQTTSRDWAGALAPQIENYSSRLSGRDPFSYYQQGADAAYGQATRYLLPKQQQDMQALESRLGEQGFVPGTPAYAQALRQQLDSNAVALADARDRAITAGQKGGYDAYTGETSALTGAMTGLNNLGTLGVSNDTNAFKQNLDAGNFFNDAQGQTFDQSKIASDRVRQTGLDANTVAQQLFENTVTMTDTNNKNATNTFTNLRDLTSDNNKVIGANNKTAFDLADLNNKTVTDSRTMANTDYTTDTGAQQKLVADALSQVNKGITGTTAPGAGISNVGAAQTPDLAALLQQFFGNNANIANANTASNNAQMQALGQLLQAIIPGLFGK